MSSTQRIAISSLMSLLLTACPVPADEQDAGPAGDGGGEADGGASDLSSGQDSTTAGQDAGGGTDTFHAGVDASDPQSCSRSGFTSAYEYASTTAFGLEYAAISALAPPLDILQVQRYDDYGGPTTPGTYSLDGINYRDCGLCLLARASCEGNSCDKTFYSQQGSVDITAIGDLGQRFTATLHGVVFEEVTIDESFVSTPVPGGETWCLDGYSFDQLIKTDEEAYCGRPDVACVGEVVTDFSLQSCGNRQMVSLSTLAAQKKALWLVLVAGWCPGCRDWIPEVWSTYTARQAEGLELVYVLGENQNQNGQPTIEYCQSYAGGYAGDGVEVANFYIDHDGVGSFATTFGYMNPYLAPDGTFLLPWNALLDADTLEYSYADGAGGDLDTVLNQLLAQ